MKRSYFKRKKTTPLKRAKIRLVGQSDTTIIKSEIQALLRELVILRDGGCILNKWPHTGACGGVRKDGTIILQAEHLHTRSNSSTFADSRLAVCICVRHHIYYKPQHGDEYYRLAKLHIGEKNTKLLEAVAQDFRPHKPDWKLAKLALERELKDLKKLHGRT